jgi:hypothetical protein
MIFHPRAAKRERKIWLVCVLAELTPNCIQFIKTRPAKRTICLFAAQYQLALGDFSA